ncbi:pyruvate formate-lyase activating enzyme-like uncharacterized protein [Methanohalophilus levihalophilus]|uniref:radical SAM protein n=1 Tax=Methanohalophilus levihalophilus TaxID=1431282 RepID=UPI001AE3092F|nr:radical SAM protein [Methanohalophilus levihalophilus]MBP2029267.1 pyruvate formate-lyase activating enzyme-like uncharacterized protein [Methanohalophilus levihalophilus]
MRDIKQGDADSFHTYLTEGCKLCQEGAKMVLFVTGICDKSCFYCPISEERKGKQVYANEQPISKDLDIIEEANRMDALGTGITGGEPLIEKELVLRYINLLKNTFGKKHHIHLYTASAPDKTTVSELAEAGLDEIRFHPPQSVWEKIKDTPYAGSMAETSKLGIETGFELPSIEGVEALIKFASKNDYFVNLNELEFSDTNAEALKERSFVLVDDISNAVLGSRSAAIKAINGIMKGHFCSSRYKDAIQLRKRLLRTAEVSSRPFEMITDDGTIVFGIINTDKTDEVKKILLENEVPEDLYEIIGESIEIAAWVLEEMAEFIQGYGSMTIVEKYPIKDGIIVESMPLLNPKLINKNAIDG